MMSSITFSFISVVNFLLQPIRKRLESLKIKNHRLARWLCKAIPASCPFEREIKLGDRTLVHIPPLCKLNPFYEQLIEIRFKALIYLADECGEDVTQFC